MVDQALEITMPRIWSATSEEIEMVREHDDLCDTSQDSKIMRRVDWRVLPSLAILYAWSLIDRMNIGNAQIEGMREELRLDIGVRYSIILLIFFPFYFIVELPATLIVRKVQPRIFISLLAMCWGFIMLGMGFVKSWEMLGVCRALLGLLEGPFFPTCVYLISSWYTRYELQKRITLFYVVGVLGTGLSSILAYGLARIGPTGHYKPWSFIFFIEGAITILLSVVCFPTIVDFPHHARKTFLSQQEHARFLRRLALDRSDLDHDDMTSQKVIGYLCEWKAWSFSFMFMAASVTPYALAFFLPTILRRRLQFPLVEAQCLKAPPYIFAALFSMTTATLSDKYRLRVPFIIFHAVLCLLGLTILYFESVPSLAQYFAVFLISAGTSANIPAIISFMQNNIHTSSRRAVMSAMQIGFGAIGGVIGSLVFRQQDAPLYRPGILTCLSCNILIIVVATGMSVWFTAQNKRQENGADLEGKKGFRYVV